jgi:putative DNA primase/helicase
MSADLLTQAAAAIQAAGIPFPSIEADGRFHRLRRADHYWCIANAGTFPDGRPWLTVSAGDARENGGVSAATVTWRSYRPGELTAADRRALKAQQAQQKKEVELRLNDEHESARRRACVMWSKARPGHHAYLERKAIDGGNTRIFGDDLLIPAYHLDGTLLNVQRIRPDGAKHVLPGGRFAETYHPIRFHGIDQPKCLLAEGYATAMTLHVETGDPAICAFCADNLVRLAKRLPREFPGVKDWIVCGDADPVGTAKAIESARILGGRWVVPDFTGLPATAKDTDFNDLVRLQREVQA